MLTDHRYQEILSRLNGTGRVGVSDVAAYLRVSEETIRRDLKVLEERGVLRRIHGGAVPPRLDQDRPLHERGKTNPREKAKVAANAEGLIRTGCRSSSTRAPRPSLSPAASAAATSR